MTKISKTQIFEIFFNVPVRISSERNAFLLKKLERCLKMLAPTKFIYTSFYTTPDKTYVGMIGHVYFSEKRVHEPLLNQFKILQTEIGDLNIGLNSITIKTAGKLKMPFEKKISWVEVFYWHLNLKKGFTFLNGNHIAEIICHSTETCFLLTTSEYSDIEVLLNSQSPDELTKTEKQSISEASKKKEKVLLTKEKDQLIKELGNDDMSMQHLVERIWQANIPI